MTKCAWCPWDGDPKFLRGHCEDEHFEEFLAVWRGERAIDLDIRAAQRQAGFPVDADIVDDFNPDDEDLSDARLNS